MKIVLYIKMINNQIYFDLWIYYMLWISTMGWIISGYKSNCMGYTDIWVVWFLYIVQTLICLCSIQQTRNSTTNLSHELTKLHIILYPNLEPKSKCWLSTIRIPLLVYCFYWYLFKVVIFASESGETNI